MPDSTKVSDTSSLFGGIQLTKETAGALAANIGLKALAAVFIIVVGGLTIRYGGRLIQRVLTRAIHDTTVRSYLMTAIRSLMWVVLVIILLGSIGIEATSLLAVLGAAGLAIGLALQGSLSNIAAGVMLLVYRPFTVDEEVEIAGVTGTVREVGLISTVVDGPDGVRAYIPNSLVFSGVIRNRAVLGTRRVEQRVRVRFGSNLDDVRSRLIELAKSRPDILPMPEPSVTLVEESPAGVLLVLRVQTITANEQAVRLWLAGAARQTLIEARIPVVDGSDATPAPPLPKTP